MKQAVLQVPVCIESFDALVRAADHPQPEVALRRVLAEDGVPGAGKACLERPPVGW